MLEGRFLEEGRGLIYWRKKKGYIGGWGGYIEGREDILEGGRIY